jgi:hypothetical protein
MITAAYCAVTASSRRNLPPSFSLAAAGDDLARRAEGWQVRRVMPYCHAAAPKRRLDRLPKFSLLFDIAAKMGISANEQRPT